VRRIFHPGDLALETTVALRASASQHVAKVLRLTVGEEVAVFNGQGGHYTAQITHITKQEVLLNLRAYHSSQVESPLYTCLAQGISRGDKMDITLQKAVELGVNCIVPLFTERCGVKLEAERLAKRMQHWQAVIESACEQCGRDLLPTLAPAQSLAQWLPHAPESLRLLLNPHQAQSVDLQPAQQGVSLLIGPEGGLSPSEIALASKYQFLSWRLGPRILRTETAALVALSKIQTLWGDLC